ncbi:rRNA-processing protein UTP23 homolog isoform X2 [Actinia tenebrosa]|uniref:rRNA-processing protein UTP23 homolog isoform X2 n=1 Tax=Actinia tenebrosa TaxID=6105 RepID=A0A6P8II08_ACTTE|nr:rRNA-processing protein UTP23 homolog isoform X2 [Actinia tenebrosa]
MKVKRVKGAKKIINFYKNSFGIFEPYQVLIDLTFCQAAILGGIAGTALASHPGDQGSSPARLSVIWPSNTNRYFVATQDRELQTHLESIPGVPLMYLNHNCMVLEKPTPLSYDTAQQIQDSKVNPTSLEKETIAKLKGEPESEEKRRRKRKKPSGPNPLSILKKKRTADKTMSQTVKKKRIRKRKKAKVPTHVLQALTKES